MRHGTRVGAAALSLALMLTGPMVGTADAQLTDDAIPALTPEAKAVEACHAIFGRDALADVPARALVSPGEDLSLDVTWGTDWKAGAPVEVVNCAAVDGVFSDSLSSRNRNETNDGLFVVEFNVPAATPEGARLCERTAVIGQSAAGAPKAERLDAECFTVAAAAPGRSNDPGAAANQGREAAGGRDGAATGTRPPGAAPRPGRPGMADDGNGKSAPSGGTPQGPQGLARTGSAERMLAAVAGLLMLLGGRMIAWSSPARPTRRRLI